MAGRPTGGRLHVYRPAVGLLAKATQIHRKYSYSILCNSAPGLDIGLPGRILAGLLPGKNRNRPFVPPEADFGTFPVAVRPQSGPDGRSTARKHYCVTQSTIHLKPGRPPDQWSTSRLAGWVCARVCARDLRRAPLSSKMEREGVDVPYWRLYVS